MSNTTQSENLEWYNDKEVFKWAVNLSPDLKHKDADGDLLDKTKHGSGHADKSISEATAGFIICSVILLVLATMYMAVRVYSWGKKFSRDWNREHAPMEDEPNQSRSQNYRNDEDDSDDSERQVQATDVQMVKENKKDVKQQIKGMNESREKTAEISKTQDHSRKSQGVVNAEEIKIDGIDEEEEESEEQDDVEEEADETEEEHMDKSASKSMSRSAPKIAQNTSMQHQQKLKEKQQRIVEMENMKRQQQQDLPKPGETSKTDALDKSTRSRRSMKSPAKKNNDEEEYYDEEEEYEEEEDNEDNKGH